MPDHNPTPIGHLTDEAMDRIIEGAYEGRKAICPFCRGARLLKEVDAHGTTLIALSTCYVCNGKRLINIHQVAA